MQKRWFGFLVVSLFVVAVVLVNRFYLVPTLVQPQAIADSTSIETIEIKEPSLLYGMVVDNYTVIEDKIKRNEVLGDILSSYNVPANIIHQISKLSRNVFEDRKSVV